MFYVREVRNLLRPAIFERGRGRLGSKISGYGQLAEVAVYFAVSGLPPEVPKVGEQRPGLSPINDRGNRVPDLAA